MSEKIGFVFDMDGTLINTTEIGDIVGEAIYKEFNIQITEILEQEIEELIEKLLHGTNRKNIGPKIMLTIFKKIGLSFRDRIKALCISGRIYKDELKKIKLYDGVDDVFNKLDELGYDYMIATTSSTKEVDDRLKLFPHFYKRFNDGKIISRSSVKNMKPAPDQINLASKIMKIPTNKLVMVGDMNSDIEMGNNVNAITIGVLTGVFTREKFLESGPDFIIASVAEIPIMIDKIIEKMRAQS